MLALAAPFDLLALPTVPVPAYAAELPTLPGQSLHAPFANTLLFNLTEQPAVSLNCGFTRAGLPVGLQLVGRRHDDAGLLRLAHALEGATGAAAGLARPHLISRVLTLRVLTRRVRLRGGAALACRGPECRYSTVPVSRLS